MACFPGSMKRQATFYPSPFKFTQKRPVHVKGASPSPPCFGTIFVPKDHCFWKDVIIFSISDLLILLIQFYAKTLPFLIGVRGQSYDVYLGRDVLFSSSVSEVLCGSEATFSILLHCCQPANLEFPV